MMRERLKPYLSPPVFPADEDKTFTASLLHVILWSVLVGICLYTLIAPIQPQMRLIAWLYVLALGGLTLALMSVMRRGYVQLAAILVNIGLWIILTVAAYFNGGVAAPAYSGYLIVIICTSLLVSWQWGLAVAVASALTGAVFLLAANKNSLPDWQSTYTYGSVWSANVAYFFVASMLLALALHAIKRASQQMRHETAERLKTEQALSYSEQRFRAIFDSVNDAIFVQDLSDGRILDVNQRMCEMYGYTTEEARHLLVGDLSADYTPYTQQDALAWMQKAASGKPQVFEWHAKTHDGRLFWVEVNMRLAPIDERDRLLVVVRDIDDRKRAEEALRREQAYYEAIVNATPVMLWLKDTENRILRFNPAAARIEGVDAAEVEGKSAYDLYPREQAEAYHRDDLEVIRSGQPKLGIIEQYMTMGSGKQLWVEMGKVPVRDGQGNIVGVLACAIDITERKEAEERERRVSQGLRTVIEAAQELINCADLNSLYRRSVELAREKLGLERCGLYLLDEREEFIQGTFGTDHQGRTTDERGARYPIQDHPEVFSLADRLWVSYESSFVYWKDDHDHMLEGKGWNAATPIRSRRRTVGVLYSDAGISQAPLDETQQDIVAVYCSLLGGLLELKRAEAELAHERDLLRSLMDNFPDTIYFKDTTSRFTRINRAQARMLGLATPEDAIGRTDADFFQNSDLHQMFLMEEERLMTSGEPIIDRVEYNPTPDGQPRWLSASKVPLRDTAGQIVGMVGISRDITDRMLAEQREKTISLGLRAVIEATQELIDCADLDNLYQRGVELAREKLGLERCGLHLLAEDQQYLLGTYGTDQQGRTSDERQERVTVAEHEEVFAVPDRLWTVLHKPLTYWREGATQVQTESGWIAATPIRSRRQNIGILYNDTATTHAPLDKNQQEVIAVYCSLLGSLIELKRAEAELAHERDLLQALMDNIPDMIYFKDTASRFTRINRAQAHMLGLASPAEAIGKTDLDFQDRQLADSFLAEEQELVRAGQPLVDRIEYNPTRGGRPRWLTSTKVPLHDTAGQIYGIAGVSRDVTDRMLAQRRDQTISQGQRAVIEAADELMSCADLDTLYRRAVELAREKLKVERCGLFALDEQGWLRGTFGTDLQGQTSDERSAHFQPINLAGLDAASNRLWKIIESEHAFWEGHQQRVVGAGWVGATFIRTRERVMGVFYNDTAISHTPADEAQQEVLAVYCSLLGSLIELKRAEEALRESESTMRALLDAIPDAIFRFDPQGVFKDYIPAKSFATWLPPGEFIGRPYPQVLPPEIAQQLTDNFQVVLETGEPRLYEYALPLNGQTHYYESRLAKMAQGDVLGIVRDLTDRKQAELALQQREAYLRSILDNFPYWIWLKDITGRFLAVNKTLAKAYGYASSEALVGKTVDDIASVELAQQYQADDRQVMESRTQKLVEEIVVEQGVEKWFETFKSPVLDAQGNVIGTAGFAHDVTGRRQVEAAMRESEALFRYLADNAPALIALSDERGLATYLNRAWLEFRGEVPAQLSDEWAERIHPDDRSRYLFDFQAALQGQRKFTTEYRLRRADGQYRWLLDTVVPRYTADERFAGFIGIAVDITDRKNAEEALRRSAGRLRLLTDNMVDSISQVDAQQRLVYASPSAERVFGYAVRELLGRLLYDFVHPEDAVRLRHNVLMAAELHAPSLRIQYRYRHAVGHDLWVESEVRLLYDDHGSFAGAVFGSRDISVRKQVEAERENLIEELADKNAELERFTYTVSHDLKSPLITIRGFLGFLEKDARSGDLDRLRADITRITEATTRMQRLLDELLELSRIGRTNNLPEVVPFAQIAREAVELVQGRIMTRGVPVEIAADLPAVYGDRLRLVEVLQNLVDNAVKFMGDQTEPHITIGTLGAQRSELPVFFVQDNGVGIEPEYFERIFGLFNKLDAKSEGTGVGLALVKRIIDLHGGHIWVESDGAGRGSTFYFTLSHQAPPAKDA